MGGFKRVLGVEQKNLGCVEGEEDLGYLWKQVSVLNHPDRTGLWQFSKPNTYDWS